jgi:hypothetical protein
VEDDGVISDLKNEKGTCSRAVLFFRLNFAEDSEYPVLQEKNNNGTIKTTVIVTVFC